VQAVVRPYLDSKFSIQRSSGPQRPRVVFGSQSGLSFKRWLMLWMAQMVDQHATGMPAFFFTFSFQFRFLSSPAAQTVARSPFLSYPSLPACLPACFTCCSGCL
jgi:hypothetical protein